MDTVDQGAMREPLLVGHDRLRVGQRGRDGAALRKLPESAVQALWRTPHEEPSRVGRDPGDVHDDGRDDPAGRTRG
jgi:hypothetical protein